MKERPCLQILQPVDESRDSAVNDETTRCYHHDGYKRGNNPVSGRRAGTRNLPTYQTDVSNDHNAQPEPEMRDLLLRPVQLRHTVEYHFSRSLTTPRCAWV